MCVCVDIFDGWLTVMSVYVSVRICVCVFVQLSVHLL